MMAPYDDRGRAYKQFRDGIVEEPVFRSLIAHSGTVPLVIQLLSPGYSFAEYGDYLQGSGRCRDDGADA